ncbi:hypothetical protein MJO29_000861 [Puccinia striiformis f. sp. tritici]|uniref:CLASP N-terminal domain-containing protein n=1 Tax=Puccinia striiformis f. sp. tritici PST-78 TaxID=1165861 RepID=A0A0L0VY64_9BASI|nr:hypothetical protein Pst134EA_000871 [Puccinia striiformis f. sp. tritici]KAH9473806.1 hypothetical protein Pst134EA_000871 [Puccinia striiformis f. sp. tritici]KAI7967584.1 hypothetical protein MJO29_000861 [Puccinia striiformis f. sp. tritici]KNF04249.1 hypothetical protein PSTG_02596 [Puccinia striiformis f. sp. tritici PST-78]
MVKKMLEEPVRITSASQCLHEFDMLKEALSIEETEDTWLNIDASLKRFTAAIRGGACEHPDEFLKRWKETDIVRGIVSAMSTERTRLSGTALDLVSATSRLGSYWDSAVPFYAPTIVKLLGRASKIYVTRATITLTSLIKGTKSLGFIPYLLDGISEKSVTIRIGCADALLCCLTDTLNDNESSDSRKPRSNIRDGLNKRLNDIENTIKIGGRDRDPKVRAIFKRIWEIYEQQWPARALSLAQPLTPTIKRYLGIGSSSTLTSSHASQASSNGQAHRETNPSRDKATLSGHHRTGSKNVTEATATKTATAHPSKPIKAHSSHSTLAKVGDLGTLQKAMMVPLPPDDHEHREAYVTRGPGRARVLSTKTPPEGSIHQAQSSGQTMKRSNSTMRAQRVPLPPQVDVPVVGANAKPRTATRVPLQPIQSTQTGKDGSVKPTQVATSASSHQQSSTKTVAASATHEAPKATFKPIRSVSGTSQPESKPSHQLQQPPAPPQTRPLPRRAVPEPSKDIPPSVPLVSNTLNVSVRSHARKVQVEESAPAIKLTMKAFKPTKSCSKSSSNATITSSKSSSAKPDKSSKSGPTATSSSADIPTKSSQVPVRVDELPEMLRLPVLTPLPSSPTPPHLPLSSSVPPLLSTPKPVSQPDSLPLTQLLSSSQPLPIATTLVTCETSSSSEPLPAAVTGPSAEIIPPSVTLLPSEILVPSKPIPPAPISPSVTTPPRGAPQPVKAVQLASSPPLQKISPHDAIQSGQSVPVTVTSPTVFHQSLSSKPAESQQSNVPVQSYPFFLAGFGTPGPKICTRLPDDLIVPMSVPLPPSPNSPFVGLRVAHETQGSRKKPIRTQRSPRSRTNPSGSRLTGTPAAKNGNIETGNQDGDMTFTSSPGPMRQGQFVGNNDVGANQQSATQEGVLVDFDHEDTIWIPRPPTLHQDLLQLDDNLGLTPTIDEESDGEDGPQEKRQRTNAENSCSSNDSTLSISRNVMEPELCVPPELAEPRHHHAPRRDPSMFHWDQPDLETDGDDSEDKTISCLKEEPPFLPGDVTVNEGTSFHTNFLGGLNAQNQSTPVPGGAREVGFRRFGLSNLSP